VNLNHVNPEPRTAVSGTCAAANLGQQCTESATLLEPVALCDEHKVQVALLVAPEVLSAVLAEVRVNQHGPGHPSPSVEVQLINAAQAVKTPSDERHEPLVYFMANGGRVKIGHTKSLAARLRALSLPGDAVLLLLQGGLPLERALHLKFRSFRIGKSEWFELAPEIVHFIASKSTTLNRPLTSTNKLRGRFGVARRPRRTRAQIRIQLEAALQDLSPGARLRVKPLAEQIGANRRIVRELLDEMGVRPVKEHANGR
jgi:hypothetical protein